MDLAFETIGVDGSLLVTGKESPMKPKGKESPRLMGEEDTFKLD